MQKTLYIEEPPETIPCWYCRETCVLTKPYTSVYEYFCLNHSPLKVMFGITQHQVPPPNWFFNRFKITLKNLRISHNLYSGRQAYLEKYRVYKEGFWGSGWDVIADVDSQFFITTPINKIYSYLNLYKVWS